MRRVRRLWIRLLPLLFCQRSGLPSPITGLSGISRRPQLSRWNPRPPLGGCGFSLFVKGVRIWLSL